MLFRSPVPEWKIAGHPGGKREAPFWRWTSSWSWSAFFLLGATDPPIIECKLLTSDGANVVSGRDVSALLATVHHLQEQDHQGQCPAGHWSGWILPLFSRCVAVQCINCISTERDQIKDVRCFVLFKGKRQWVCSISLGAKDVSHDVLKGCFASGVLGPVTSHKCSALWSDMMVHRFWLKAASGTICGIRTLVAGRVRG